MITHGNSSRKYRSPEYLTWDAMIQRCGNPNTKFYKNYGGRGIKVCRRWHKFENFYRDMGKKSNGYVIDRIDNNKGYNKSNCRWVSRSTSNRNLRRNIWLRLNGNRILFVDALKQLGIKSSGSLYYYRKKYNFTSVEALKFILRKRKNETGRV